MGLLEGAGRLQELSCGRVHHREKGLTFQSYQIRGHGLLAQAFQ